ncbi:uncharacterized protein LOC133034457 [Cannabis sativa]|uniref:uncharacterized protein LOC133034457 n=1 Tax=Cannabis sativa TaxID=3483 RepID=UPI0029CAAA9D|nr:uncharacterized protein LOC133034457 [Cannabis sativa]
MAECREGEAKQWVKKDVKGVGADEEKKGENDAQTKTKEATVMGGDGKNKVEVRLGKEGGKDGAISHQKAGDLRGREVDRESCHGAKLTGAEGVGEAEENWETPKRAHLLKAKQVVREHGEHHKEKNTFEMLQNKENGTQGDGGLNKEKKQEAVIKVCQKKEIGVGALVETKLKSEKKKTFARVIVIEETSQYVHCYVKLASHTEAFCVTFVYGMNGLEERKLLWKGLANLRFPVRPWILLGDFNSLINYGDRVGGSKDRIHSRIDHAFKNEDWLDLFPNSSASFSWEKVSNHCAIVISSAVMVEIGVKPFRFFNYWTEHREFKNLVLESWQKPVFSSGLLGIWSKLARLNHVLKSFNHARLGNVELDFQKAKDKFLEARLQAQSNPGVERFIKEEKDAADSFHLREKMLKSFLVQRSKVTWLNQGDGNNAYFYACIKKRREENRIASFVDIQGNIVDNYPNVVRHYIDHFKSYMGSCSLVSRKLDNECLELGNRLTLNQQLRLIQSFSNKEIKEDLFSIPSSKSPGPDGYNSEFFKAMWKEIGGEVCLAIKDFFNTGKIPVQFNETVISLIPKVENPMRAIHYRPIACCSTLYKCITKLMSKRLAEDLIKNYGRKNVSPRCAIKIDLNKAYDTVDWGFVEDLLVGLNFPSKFVGWIMKCLRGTSYSIMMNGRLHDDLILFSKGTFLAAHHLKNALGSFSEVTGLFPNKDKSLVYFWGVNLSEKEVILEDLQFREGSFPLKYLGVPLRPTKWRREDCDAIIKKIKMWLVTWATRHLSYAGRIQLIRSVLFGLRNYWMSIFILPQSVIKEVERLCRGFLWGVKGDRSKIHLASWDKVCLPKPFGGLGFKNGASWNRSILGKFVWAIMDKHDILWVKWVNNIYMKGAEFWEYELKGDVSWYWRKICHLRSHFSKPMVTAAVRKGKFIAARLYMGTLKLNIDSYYKSVWCNFSLPKHKFILWQLVHGHLLTRDNFQKFHIILDSSYCPVCDIEEESHHHLFFNCCVSREVVKQVFD